MPEKRREQGQKNTEGHQATGGLPKTAKWNTRGREGQRTQRVTITKESQKKKRWRKAQQGEARKDAKRRKPTEQKEATQRREEEHRGK